jgi:hypothetical protein
MNIAWDLNSYATIMDEIFGANGIEPNGRIGA